MNLESRVTALEQLISKLPCSTFNHHDFPVDEEYELDEDGYETSVNICRNCGYKFLKPKLIFKNHPIPLWPTIKKLKNNKSTLKVYECKSCLLIQLQRFRNKDVIKFYEPEQFIIEDKNLSSTLLFSYLILNIPLG